MPRKNSSLAFDRIAAAELLCELGVCRKQFIRARIRVLNAAGALVRRGLGWNADLDESERSKISKQAARIMAADDADTLPDDLAEIARALAADIATAKAMARPGEVHQRATELKMRKLARQFPVWEAWGKEVRGFSDLGLAIVISEAGLLENYSNKGKLWKRLGLAPFSKDGETRAMSQWRMKGGLSADDWTVAGYSPRRRATIFAQVGTQIIGGMGRGYRPRIGEDIEQNGELSHYEKVFVRRLRYEAARDPDMRRPDTDEGKESYSKACAEKARYYTEKIFIRDLWVAWRRAKGGVPETAKTALPSASHSVAPSGAGLATIILPSMARDLVPDLLNAPQGAVSARDIVPSGHLLSAGTTVAAKAARKAAVNVPKKASSSMPAHPLREPA